MLSDLSQLLRYLLVGGFITAVDAALYQILTGRQFRWPRIPASLVSTTCGMALGFGLHLILVFQPAEFQLGPRLIRYLFVVACSVYIVQSGVIYLFQHLWALIREIPFIPLLLGVTSAASSDSIDRLLGKLAAVTVGMTWNFIWFKLFVYA
jgi:putative flippase GtrA